MSQSTVAVGRQSLSKIISGTLMIAGSAIGAGMLGIPLLTAEAGFWPSLVITGIVWLFMLCTGLLFLEVTLWMPGGSNILSMSQRFLGKKGKVIAGFMFIFLYYSLMVAYFAAGAPLVSGFINATFGLNLSGILSYALFGVIFGGIVAIGAKAIERVSVFLTIAMVVDYFIMVGMGCSDVDMGNFQISEWSAVAFSLPVLFSAFGYHNIIPSLCDHMSRERKTLKLSIILGTSVPFLIYVAWQWLVIGAIPQAAVLAAREAGQPATQALQSISGGSSIFLVGQYFAFFAIVTSMLGVAFSLVDFIGDGLKVKREGPSRHFLVFLTFFPPFLCVVFDPTLFDRALGVAGGFGEAFLNGLLPVMLVWMGRYAMKLPSDDALPGGKWTLGLLLLVSLFVICLELFLIFSH
ncbi:MAG: amino acid permease [Chlamydiales bacterium]|nr:amino acid permease [Chlamydiales bacterium]